MLHKAGAKAIPKYRKIKSLKTCGKGIWNSKISQKSKEAKRANWQWKNSKNYLFHFEYNLYIYYGHIFPILVL
jgi:hypothetical protein